MKVMITGAAGQVGTALCASVPRDIELHAMSRAQLNIADADAVCAAVQSIQPEVVINAAGYTAVDRAEAEPELAAAANAQGPANLARAVLTLPQCRLLQLSTDYVFDGRSSAPYMPDAMTNPLSVYGHTKLRGEHLVRELLKERAVVLRTAWVYAARGKNFLLTMLRLMRERASVRVVADQRGTPTTAASIAHALWAIVHRADIQGAMHWTDAGTASWYEFAAAISEDAYACGLLSRAAQVTPISTADYPTAAHRPANSVLDTRQSIDRLRMTPQPWRTNLRATLASVAA